MKNLCVYLTAIFIALLSGCASVPMAPLDLDVKAKDFTPPADKASLYVYRNETFGAAVPMSVSINGKMLGQTAAQTYFRLNLIPGKYNIESHAENVSSLPLTAETGKNYFVWQEVKMGVWMARNQLQQTDETTGRAGVLESKLIAMSISESDLVPLDSPPAIPASSQDPNNDTASQKLKKLNDLKNDGLISEDEYQQKKEQILEKL